MKQMHEVAAKQSAREWRSLIATTGFVGFLFAALGTISRIFILVMALTGREAAIYRSDFALGFAVMSLVGFVLGLFFCSISSLRQSESQFATLGWYCLMVNAIGYIAHWLV